VILNSTGCLMRAVKNVMTVVISLQHSEDDITVESVDKSSVVNVVIRNYREEL
jgi:hypothetical protein